ncbi:hypothetical protein C7820_4230 [Paenibacillus sp. VMFN-D1]|nr:hypothetical protein C7820_4230 [Paenibacillus sp. VMFN-D1]
MDIYLASRSQVMPLFIVHNAIHLQGAGRGLIQK